MTTIVETMTQGQSNFTNHATASKRLRRYPPTTLSQTVPDMALSMEQIFQRFRRGQPLPTVGGDIPQYFDKDDIRSINLKKLDLTERKILIDTLSEEVQSIKKRHMDELSKKEKEAFKSKIKAEIEEEQKQQQNPPPALIPS